MEESLLRKIQKIEKEMLDAFVSICEKENLKYYLYAGTALGAVRHKGFIPWDDDIDVCMPRKDYDTFILVANKYLNDNLELLHYTTKKEYSDYTAKLVRNDIILNVKFENHIIEHKTWIDIFPLDGAPNNRIKRFFHYRKLNMYKLMLILHYINEFDKNKKRQFVKRMIIIITKTIPVGKFFNPIKVCQNIDKQLKKNNYEKSKIIGSFLGPLREKEMAPSWCYDEGRNIVFEGSEYIVPKRVEDYLKFTYGDYMKLPPMKDRKPEHHNIVSLEMKQ